MDVQEVRVLVPTARVTEFYRWFADWCDGAPSVPQASGTAVSVIPPSDRDSLLSAGAAWWRSLRPNERAVWWIWVEKAPKPATASEIVTALELKGPRDIPGILSWSGRKGRKAGFPVAWSFEYDAVTGEPMYGLKEVNGITALEYADLLKRARSQAER